MTLHSSTFFISNNWLITLPGEQQSDINASILIIQAQLSIVFVIFQAFLHT